MRGVGVNRKLRTGGGGACGSLVGVCSTRGTASGAATGALVLLPYAFAVLLYAFVFGLPPEP